MVRKITLPQQSWANGVKADIVITCPIHGKVEQIVVKINDNTGNRTLTLTITSQNESGQLYTKAGIPENATTVYNANKATADFDAFLCDEICTFTFTPSEDPGTTGMTADVALYVTGGQN